LKYYLHHTINLNSTLSPAAHYLFNDSRHLLLQSKKGWHNFEYRDLKTNNVNARIYFHIKNEEASSPLRAPFGSFEIYRKLTPKQVENFVLQLQLKLTQLGVKKIFIRSFPDLYDIERAQLINDKLIRSEFVSSEDISSIILVDEKPYARKIKISERQKLIKAASQFQFEKVDKRQLNKLYSFISTCREERSQSLSMTLSELKKLVNAFPDRVLFFKVGTEKEISAAAIVICVSNQILYTFYYAHAKVHNRISPVVFLMSGIYDYATRNKFKMIDLGTSMLNGHINKSLVHFKTSIGGVETKKSTFTKVL